MLTKDFTNFLFKSLTRLLKKPWMFCFSLRASDPSRPPSHYLAAPPQMRALRNHCVRQTPPPLPLALILPGRRVIYS